MIGFWLSVVKGNESNISKLLYAIMLKEKEKGFYNFKWIRCINDILVSVGQPDRLRTDSFSQQPKIRIMGIPRTLSDLYAQEWKERVNVLSKGKKI